MLKLVIGGLNAKNKDKKTKKPRTIEATSSTQKPKPITPNTSSGHTPVILGYHQVPPVAPPRLRITHLADPFIPNHQFYDDVTLNEDDDSLDDIIEARAGFGAKENMSQEQVVEMLKMHERLLYTILATIGVPLVIFVILYMEVSACSFFRESMPNYPDWLFTF